MRQRVPATRPRGQAHATLSLRVGVNSKTKIVSQRLGHATVAFTLDVYTEDVPELQNDAAEIVSELFLGPEADRFRVDEDDETGHS